MPEDKLVWHHSSSDSDWNIITNPVMEDWPRVQLTTVTFEDMGSKTKLRLTMVPIDAMTPKSPVLQKLWPAWITVGVKDMHYWMRCL